MELLFSLVHATHARGTHHKLALDALRRLKGPQARRLRRLFLAHAELYVEGAKAPDKEFKDFTNHVCHVRDGYWGGAPKKARNWYRHLVEAMADGDWSRGAYAAGVLSHYLSDPLMPFHTAQSEAENNIHRAVEWSIAKSYDALVRAAAESTTPPVISLGEGGDWLEDYVRAAATRANAYYEKLILHYDFHRGVVDPPAGLDTVAQRFIGALLLEAQAALAAVLERALEEAGATAPEVGLTAKTFIAGLKIPLSWVTRRMADARERRLVEAIYDELQATGTVERNLPEDERAVREAYAREVLGAPAQGAPAAGTAVGSHISCGYGQRPLPAREAVVQPIAPAGQGAERAHATEAPPTNVPQRLQAAVRERFAATQRAEHEPQAQVRGEAQARGEAGEPTAAPSSAKALPSTSNSPEPSPGKTDTFVPDHPAPSPRAAPKKGSESQPEPVSEKKRVQAACRLAPEDPIEAAPSIGRKTARRLAAAGIETVADLLKAEPARLAGALECRWITPELIADWQDQAALVATIPGLKGGTAQLLVGAGFRDRPSIAHASAEQLWAAIARFGESAEGQRLARSVCVPSLEEVERLIAAAHTGETGAEAAA